MVVPFCRLSNLLCLALLSGVCIITAAEAQSPSSGSSELGTPSSGTGGSNSGSLEFSGILVREDGKDKTFTDSEGRSPIVNVRTHQDTSGVTFEATVKQENKDIANRPSEVSLYINGSLFKSIISS